jgi:hypothetical protein
MKPKAFELSSSDESEAVDSAGCRVLERYISSTRESPSTAESKIGEPRSRERERWQGNIGRLIAENDVLRSLADQNRALIASRRLSFCGIEQRVRATRGALERDTSQAMLLSLRQRWKLYISMLDSQFFANSTIDACGYATCFGQ